MALTNISLMTLKYAYASRRAVDLSDGKLSTLEGRAIAYRHLEDINFSYGDGVNAELIFNLDASAEELFGVNYLAEYSGDKIISAWWVTHYDRTTFAGAYQYLLKLRRDVVSSYYGNYRKLPFYARRGWINEDISPLLFQPEGVAMDKVKTAQYPIKDETRIQWIVGYMSPNFDESVTQVTIPGTSEKSPLAVASFATLSDFYAYIGASAEQSSLLGFTYANIGVRYIYTTAGSSQAKPTSVAGVNTASGATWGVAPRPTSSCETFTALQTNGAYASYPKGQEISLAVAAPLASKINSDGWNWELVYKTAYGLKDGAPAAYMTLDGYGKLKSIQYKIIYVEDIKKNYLVKVTTSPFMRKGNTTYSFEKSSDFAQYVIENIDASPTVEGIVFSGEVGDNAVYMNYAADEVTVDLVDYEAQAATWTPRSSDTIPTADHGPYKIFCAPFADATVNVGGSISASVAATTLAVTKAQALKYVTAIAEAYGTACYDVQILPYCPAREIIGTLRTAQPVTKIIREYEGFACGKGLVDFVKDASGNDLYPIIWTANDSATFYRETKLSWYINFDKPYTSVALRNFLSSDTTLSIDEIRQSYGKKAKIKDASELWRLVSPNWQGQSFDFSAQKNGGVQSFRIDFTYRPYSPFIKVSPAFGGLYGDDFTDDRGLVCGGDYSMPRTSSEWAEYQLRNVNYENIFNRQYQTLDLNIREQRIGGIVSGVTGTSQGAAQGAAIGASVGKGGGAAGAIIGGVVGGAAALAGGIADLALDEAVRRDQLSASKDYYRMNLQNIQARPVSLARGGYQIQINQEAPTLEYYVAPETELTAFESMIDHSSMTMGVDTAIWMVLRPAQEAEFTWVEGEFEELGNGANASNEVLRAMRDEFQAGVYLPNTIEESY